MDAALRILRENVNVESVWPDMRSYVMHVNERLSELRRRADLSIEELAREAGYRGASSIQRYFAKDYEKPVLPLPFARRMADALAGRGSPPITKAEVLALTGIDADTVHAEVRGPNADYVIGELDVRSAGGHGGLPESEHREQRTGTWRIPGTVMRAQTSAPPDDLKIITVYGDSMDPEFLPGDKVIVDTQDRVPSPPGIFVLWDGFGTVIKRVEAIPYSDPPTIRLMSANKEYHTTEHPLAEVHINGRVIGKWQWK